MREVGIIKRGPRFDVAYDCAMTDGHGKESQVRITDISRHGCKIVSDKPLKIGEQVVIRIALQGERVARIRWSLGNDAGAAFSEPLDLTA